MKKLFMAACFFMIHVTDLYGVGHPRITDILKLESPVFINAVHRLRLDFDPITNKYPGKEKFLQFIFASPLEIDDFGNFTSFILKDFSYKKVKRRISFKLKDNIKFSDGTPISIEDVAFAILRMMYLVPGYPVLRDIKGVDEWLKSESPLKNYPSGFKLRPGKLSITLKNPVKTPLYGFSHSFYSVLPKSCFNLDNGNLKCSFPPSSGRFILEPPGRQSYFRFKKRPDTNEPVPETIWLINISPRVLFSYLPWLKKNTVVMVNNIDLPPGHLDLLSAQLHRYMFPAARTLSILINKNNSTFADQKIRQFIASEFRKTIESEGHLVTGSVFPSILPGYRSVLQLQRGKKEPFSEQEKAKMIAHLKKHHPVLLQQDLDQYDTFWNICQRTFRRLKIRFDIYKNRGRLPFSKVWYDGHIGISLIYRGFWPENPYYDFLDLTIPHIFPKTAFLNDYPNMPVYVSNWNLFKEPKILTKINQFLFDNAEMAPVAQYSRYFFSSHKVEHFLPYSKTTPYVWNFFTPSNKP